MQSLTSNGSKFAPKAFVRPMINVQELSLVREGGREGRREDGGGG